MKNTNGRAGGRTDGHDLQLRVTFMHVGCKKEAHSNYTLISLIYFLLSTCLHSAIEITALINYSILKNTYCLFRNEKFMALFYLFC